MLLAFLAALAVAPSAPARTALATALVIQPGKSKSRGKGKGGSSGSSGTPTPTPAPAPTLVSREWNVCGGPTPLSLLCASVQVNVFGTLTTVRVRNVSGDPALSSDGVASAGQWVLTTVGFDGIANAAGTFTTAIGTTTGPWWQRTPTSTAPASWARFDDGQHGGGVNVDFGIDNGGGVSAGIASGCAPIGTLPSGSNRLWMTPVAGCGAYSIADATANDGWFETRFQTIEAWDPRGTDVALMFKGQNGPGGGSYECVYGGTDPRGGCVDAEQYYGDQGNQLPPGSVVPEPGTVFLTAGGLLALAVPAVRRRLRRQG